MHSNRKIKRQTHEVPPVSVIGHPDKAEYVRPKMVRHGSVRDLTQRINLPWRPTPHALNCQALTSHDDVNCGS